MCVCVLIHILKRSRFRGYISAQITRTNKLYIWTVFNSIFYILPLSQNVSIRRTMVFISLEITTCHSSGPERLATVFGYFYNRDAVFFFSFCQQHFIPSVLYYYIPRRKYYGWLGKGNERTYYYYTDFPTGHIAGRPPPPPPRCCQILKAHVYLWFVLNFFPTFFLLPDLRLKIFHGALSVWIYSVC